MSGVVETVEVDPTQAVGRLLHPEGWRVERSFAYDGGTWLLGKRDATSLPPQFGPNLPVEHGETVTVVVECTPEDCAWTPSQACCDNNGTVVEGDES